MPWDTKAFGPNILHQSPNILWVNKSGGVICCNPQQQSEQELAKTKRNSNHQTPAPAIWSEGLKKTQLLGAAHQHPPPESWDLYGISMDLFNTAAE